MDHSHMYSPSYAIGECIICKYERLREGVEALEKATDIMDTALQFLAVHNRAALDTERIMANLSYNEVMVFRTSVDTAEKARTAARKLLEKGSE